MLNFLKIAIAFWLVSYSGAVAQVAINNPQISLDQTYETGIPQPPGVPAVYASKSNLEDWMIDGYRGFCNHGVGVYTIQRQRGGPLGTFLSVRVAVSAGGSAPGDTNCHLEMWLPPEDIAALAPGSLDAKDFIFSWFQRCPGVLKQSVAFSAAMNARYFLGSANYTKRGDFQRLWIGVPGDKIVSEHYAGGLKIIIDLGSSGAIFEQPTQSAAWTTTVWQPDRKAFGLRVAGSFSFIDQPAGTTCGFSGFQIDIGKGDPPPYRVQPQDVLLKRAQRFICKAAPQGVPVYDLKLQPSPEHTAPSEVCGVREMYRPPVVNLSSNGRVLMACPGNDGYGSGCQNP